MDLAGAKKILYRFKNNLFEKDKFERLKQGGYKIGYFYKCDLQEAVELVLNDNKRLNQENQKTFESQIDNAIVYMDGVYTERNKWEKRLKDKIKELKDRINQMHPASDCVAMDDLETEIRIYEKLLKEPVD